MTKQSERLASHAHMNNGGDYRSVGGASLTSSMGASEYSTTRFGSAFRDDSKLNAAVKLLTTLDNIGG